MEWARAHRENELAPILVAEIAPVGGEPLHSLARGIIIEFGSDSDAASALLGTFRSGSWMGPMSNYLEIKLNSARVWLHDEHPAVREWAQNIVQGFETEIQSVRLREEEEQVLMGNR